ncbi:MAG: ROK family protein [Myxococcota bacterium]
MPITLAIDIGGTGIKMMKIDARDKPASDRIKQLTPRPATPQAILECINSMLAQQGNFDRLSVGFPGVVLHGHVKTAPNLDGEWVDFPLEQELHKLTHKPVKVANDADIQGFGLISGQGTEMVITLGTGMGAALFIDGKLVPNLELGHHPFKNDKTYEQLLGKKALEKHGDEKWNEHVQEAIDLMRRIFNFDRLYIGGGHVKNITFTPGKDVILAKNIAGLLGGLKLWR